MLTQYRNRAGRANFDTRVIFKRGEQVLLRRRQPGKLRSRAEGPYTFVSYTNTSGWVAIVAND